VGAWLDMSIDPYCIRHLALALFARREPNVVILFSRAPVVGLCLYSK
jgi:hypothetical protein